MLFILHDLVSNEFRQVDGSYSPTFVNVLHFNTEAEALAAKQDNEGIRIIAGDTQLITGGS